MARITWARSTLGRASGSAACGRAKGALDPGLRPVAGSRAAYALQLLLTGQRPSYRRASVLGGVKRVQTGHRDAERRQGVKDVDGAGMRGKDLREAFVHLRRFVGPAAA